MRFFCGKNRGAISVFLTLILVPVLIFSGIIVDISRLYAAKTVISGAGDLTMNAALARYDKQLKDSYGLITMADDPSSPSMKTYLEQSFLESCNASALKDTKSTDLHSMIQLELGTEGVEVQGVKNSSLADTQVLQQQILEYMKFRAPVYMVSDILEKFKKMPLKNMNEKKDYIEAKTDYAKKAKELGKPSENAKTAVDAHSAAIQGVQGMASEISEAMNILVQQSVFYLAAESLQKYLDNEALAPVGSGQISSAVIRQNLAGAIVWDWSETVFDEIRYGAIKLTAAEQTTDFLEFQCWFQLRSRNTIIFYRISITDNLRMFKSRHRMIHLILNILRKRTGHTSHIHFICIKPLRLQKNLMSVFIGKLDNFILNRRTISWPCSLNNTRINR